MNASRIRGFLLVHPKPTVVRVTVDDDVQEVKLGKSYAKTAETIEALGPDLLECLDAEGKVLRALRDGAEARRSDAADIPAGLAADPNALMLTHFANLLHRAYEHSTEIAFNKMVEVTDIMSARSESIEQRLERAEARNRRLVDDQIETELERAEEAAANAAAAAGGGSELEQAMMGAFLSGKLSTGAAAPTNGKTNGKPPTNGKPASKASS